MPLDPDALEWNVAPEEGKWESELITKEQYIRIVALEEANKATTGSHSRDQILVTALAFEEYIKGNVTNNLVEVGNLFARCTCGWTFEAVNIDAAYQEGFTHKRTHVLAGIHQIEEKKED